MINLKIPNNIFHNNVHSQKYFKRKKKGVREKSEIYKNRTILYKINYKTNQIKKKRTEIETIKSFLTEKKCKQMRARNIKGKEKSFNVFNTKQKRK